MIIYILKLQEIKHGFQIIHGMRHKSDETFISSCICHEMYNFKYEVINFRILDVFIN